MGIVRSGCRFSADPVIGGSVPGRRRRGRYDQWLVPGHHLESCGAQFNAWPAGGHCNDFLYERPPPGEYAGGVGGVAEQRVVEHVEWRACLHGRGGCGEPRGFPIFAVPPRARRGQAPPSRGGKERRRGGGWVFFVSRWARGPPPRG